MDAVTIQWVDMSVNRHKPSLLLGSVSMKFISNYFIYRDKNSLYSEIDNIEPTILVFQYDTPTSNGLLQLEKTKRKFPSIPILMITKSHSEALAIWALRAKVWDYFIEPVYAMDFIDVLMIISDLKNNNVQHQRGNIIRLKSSPLCKQKSPRKQLISNAESYIRENYNKKLTAAIVAEYVGMSSSHFSRQFQIETGQYFNKFLWSIRIEMAKTLLVDPSVSITSVCFDIGCTDPAYFARKFRELELISPSEYQDTMAPAATIYSI